MRAILSYILFSVMVLMLINVAQADDNECGYLNPGGYISPGYTKVYKSYSESAVILGISVEDFEVPATPCNFDANIDGVVDVLDYAYIISQANSLAIAQSNSQYDMAFCARVYDACKVRTRDGDMDGNGLITHSDTCLFLNRTNYLNGQVSNAYCN